MLEIHNGNTGTYLIMESGDKIVGRRDWRTWEYEERWGPFQAGHRSQESRAVAGRGSYRELNGC